MGKRRLHFDRFHLERAEAIRLGGEITGWCAFFSLGLNIFSPCKDLHLEFPSGYFDGCLNNQEINAALSR